MAYFNELPFIAYQFRFDDESSNQDYTLIRNIFRRAILRGELSEDASIFNFYQLSENDRPDKIADRLYDDPELDWVVLVANNIVDYHSEWPLYGDAFYSYLMDKYGSEEKLKETRYVESNEVRDDYNRLVFPKELQIQTDLYQEFTTRSGKENPLYYDLDFYPVPNKYYPLKVQTNLWQYTEIWERDNLNENDTYRGEKYEVSQIQIKKPLNQSIDGYSPNTRLDYSFLSVYSRDDTTIDIFSPNSLNGWPNTWGGSTPVYYRDGNSDKVTLYSTVGNSVDITNDFRLFYIITSFDEIDKVTFTEGTVLLDEASETYTITNPTSNLNGIQSILEIKRNRKGEVIKINVVNGGRYYTEGELLTISGSLIGGRDIIDDIVVTVRYIRKKPQFRFFTLGDTNNEPFPNVKVSTFNETGFSYLDTSYNRVDVYDNQNEVNNYDYEVKINDDNSRIAIIKPEYIGAFVGDFRNIMSYGKSSETVNNRVKLVKEIDLNN